LKGVAELTKKRHNDARGFLWIGSDSGYTEGDPVPRFDPHHQQDKDPFRAADY
jgi:hypothetical protein